ncbi:phospholipid/cholesterol/gamma-HCH transport system substrate-binding protein [Prescottella agglutinans]|uniref:Phospholipid/cholesterol/gamma-HCH transport system substrate-binding protein n=2 Tax=Prescottella agglutinans TaxID=1644129 RepID=A0ABT6M408_9NOCA|nr:phospholipid/cholesterol/gamma-HCH transport system substrate-binding protein [Prescottella agglutinans]
MRTLRTRTAAVAAGMCVIAVAATGCASGGIYSVPLPGGADIGNDPMHVKIEFDDVLDLVPQSTVKVDGVPVGRVESIAVANDGWTAQVETLVNSSVDLPANAVAEVQQSNLLGEKFIAISAPDANPSKQRLASGDTIPVGRTRHATDIEQVLGAMSLLLNGGGVAQLQPIVSELEKALDGRETKVRGLLEQANTLIAGLDEQRDSITRALDGLDTLSARVGDQTAKLEKILDELPQGVNILAEQRPQLVQMLTQVDRLGQVGTDVINESKDNLIADLRALRPTLQQLADATPDIITSAPIVPTFPFPDSIIPSIHGGMSNVFLSIDLQIGDTLSNLGVGKGDPVYYPPQYGPPVPVNPSNPYYNGNGARPGWPTVSLLPLPPIVPNPVPAPGTSPVSAPLTGPQNPFDAFLKQLGVGE